MKSYHRIRFRPFFFGVQFVNNQLFLLIQGALFVCFRTLFAFHFRMGRFVAIVMSLEFGFTTIPVIMIA